MISAAVITALVAIAVVGLLGAVFIAMWLYSDIEIDVGFLGVYVKIKGQNRRRPPPTL